MKEQNININAEEIYKCSKCGLCQKFCPVYNATKNEFYLPRGRYIILNNFFKTKQQLSNKFIQSLDICLNCGQCKKYCPSNISFEEINTEIKKTYKIKFAKRYQKILFKYKVFSFIYKFFPFKSIFLNISIDKLFNVKIKRKKQKTNQIKGNIVYFQGCFNKYINPSDKNASLNIIEKLGYKITKISNDCCGYPFFIDKDTNEFNKNAQKIIQSIPTEIDYIVCSCSTCYETLKNIEQIKDKLIIMDELLKINNIEVKINENFIHYDKEFSLMKNLFMLKQPKIAQEIAKTFDYKEKNVITSCQLTKWSLLKHNIQSYSIAEVQNILTKNK